jgi:aryl-alcohol dehydrogenase-like predicted oxidoreductase
MVAPHAIAPLTPAPLGDTGLSVAKLSLGTVKLGRDQGVKYPTPVRIPTDTEARELLATAQGLGINMLDTAPAYGRSEERLGQLLAGQRAQWLICTKVGEEFVDGQSSHDFSPEHCRFSIERSLTRLQTDYLDIVLIHSNGDDLNILDKFGTLEALQALQQAGKIRAVGISHKTYAGAERALDLRADVIMATLNTEQTQDLPLIKRAALQGCGVLIKKALSSGHGKASDLKFVSEQAGVHSIVVGTTSPIHLSENVAVLTEEQSPG